MTWSLKQQRLFLIASGAAGWNDAMRYIAMRHAGCPNTAGGDRPSIKHKGNTQAMFEQVMALAESQARANGAGHRIPKPARESWQAHADHGRDRIIHLIERIWFEAVTEFPDTFNANGLTAFVIRMTRNDDSELAPIAPRKLSECDAAQLYRICEGIKAWVGRVFRENDRWPKTFDVPRRVLNQLERRITATTGGAA